MRLFVVFLTLCSIITCSSVKKEKVQDVPLSSVIKKGCLDTLILEKRENKIFNQFVVQKHKKSSLSVIIKAIQDSTLSGVLTENEKDKLIEVFTKVKTISAKNLQTVKPTGNCGTYFQDKSSVDLLDINFDYNFFRPDGFQNTEEKDKETLILKKYIDSSQVIFEYEPFYSEKGSYFEINKNKDQYFSKNYEFYSNDGGDFFTTYKISNILDYDNSWLKSGILYRSFFKHYFSDEKRFISSQEDETLNVTDHYTYFETKVDDNNSVLNSIIIYYVTLDSSNSSEQVEFTLKKDLLTFKGIVSE
ncbi:hypothetical protein SAMN04487910_0384 [Aquimarina amphilecti]|uniref:Uncharacterized protein n=1 Tax=Aquimarina amphilecti TaxID=1038014 RepID=A0A1H7GMU5_AQUAM|nr:hypothetical protein [Aquimarina amphilecti]SEK37850.1 hypothetical protein SAMN04487910_0384 [Aquimarina amphilecti]